MEKGKREKLKSEDGTNITSVIYTEKEKKEVESVFISDLADVLHALSESISKDGQGTWLLDGGLGSYLKSQAEIYNILLEAMTQRYD